jgi:drug/metabolite transporter (DMT)-like permease
MKPDKLSWIILIALALTWGSSFILMKEGLKAFSSQEVAALRIGIASLFMLPFLVKYHGISRRHLPGLLIMGILGSLIPAFLFTAAETRISSSLAGMLNALTPLFTIVVGALFFKLSIRKNQVIGVLTGFAGAVALLLWSDDKGQSSNAVYALLIVVATLFYAISVNSIKKYLSDMNSIAATAWSFAFVGPVALIYLFSQTDFTLHVTQNPQGWTALGYVSVLAIAGSALSVIVYNVLIKRAGTLFAASCTYFIPIVAIGWGLVRGESVRPVQFLAMGIIILGVWLINRRKAPKA